MRVPIAVQIKPFDVEQSQPEIDAAREAFTRYLEEVPRKSTRSKHGLMGPVGKILSEVKSGRRDAASLKGYAIRVHEVNGRSPSPAGLTTLEEGIDRLLGLLAQAPVTAHDRILDRLDYGLYFALRKKSLEQREQLNARFQQFLEQRYHTLEELSRAWEEQVASWDRTYVFGRTSGTWSKANQAKRADINAFWSRARAEAGASIDALVEEEDEE